jgi:two-component system, OmpR family, response regulator
MRILLVEDDRQTATYVAKGLTEDGHVVDVLDDGRDALVHATSEPYDLIIVDRMLPGVDGLTLVKTLRATGSKAPILMLTSLGGVDDRVSGLEAGADDYVVKPFAFSELQARVNALARRPPMRTEEALLRAGDLEMDLISRNVRRSGQVIDLQPREFRLLEVLLRNKGRIVTRTMLLERVWDFHFDPKTSVVETHISRLRAKVDKPFDTELIQTVRGTGYTINEAR